MIFTLDKSSEDLIFGSEKTNWKERPLRGRRLHRESILTYMLYVAKHFTTLKSGKLDHF